MTMCYTDYYDGFEWEKYNYPIAHKNLECYECGKCIPRGERYEKITAQLENRIERYATHMACSELRDFIQTVVCGGIGTVLIGGLDEEIDHVDEELEIDDDAWEEAGLEPPKPMREVWYFIVEHYPVYAP
jgi:hypothetical protein